MISMDTDKKTRFLDFIDYALEEGFYGIWRESFENTDLSGRCKFANHTHDTHDTLVYFFHGDGILLELES